MSYVHRENNNGTGRLLTLSRGGRAYALRPEAEEPARRFREACERGDVAALEEARRVLTALKTPPREGQCCGLCGRTEVEGARFEARRSRLCEACCRAEQRRERKRREKRARVLREAAERVLEGGVA